MRKQTIIDSNMQIIPTEKIWQDFGVDLRRFVYSKVSDKEIVNDIIQNIFFKIHSNINSLKDNSKLGSWLFQIARNSIMDYYRGKKKAQRLLENLKKEEFFIENTSSEILQYCMDFFISRLPQKYKDALIFTEFNGNSQQELSKKEGISISASKSRVQRARQKLKQIVIDYSFFENNKESIDYFNLEEYCPLSKK